MRLSVNVHTWVDSSEAVDSRTVGIVIGVLLTVISVLIGGILYVSYRGHTGRGKCPGGGGSKTGSTPTHSLLTRKFTDRFSAGMTKDVIRDEQNSNKRGDQLNGQQLI